MRDQHADLPVAWREYRPIITRSKTIHTPVAPIAHDCVKVIFVRSGSAILFSEFGQKPVNVGDAVILRVQGRA